MRSTRPEDVGDRADIASRLSRLEHRVDSLESLLAKVSTDRLSAVGVPARTAGEAGPGLGHLSSETIPLVGRTLLALGGAFVLRAVTEAGLLHQAAGAGFGIVYALTWFWLADRAAARGLGTSATFHAITATLVAFPLIAETTAKFGYLSPTAAAALLTLLATTGLWVSWRHGLQGVSSVVTLAAAITAIVLAAPTKALVPLGCCLLALSAAAVWAGWSRQWHAQAWLVAAPVFASFLLLGVMIPLGDPERVAALIRPWPAVALLVGLVIAYVGTLIAGSLTTARDLTGGQVALGTLATAIGMGGAILTTRATGRGGLLLGAGALVCAAACYVASFMYLDRHERRLNFVFYTTVALVFTLVGLQAVLGGTALVTAFVAAAVLLAWIGGWRDRATLSLHGAVYVVTAALSSDLLTGTVSAFTAAPDAMTPWIDLAEVLVVVAAAICCGLPVARHGRTWGTVSHIPKLTVIAVAAIGGGAMATSWIAAAVTSSGREALDPAAMAALRTGVIAFLAVAAAYAGRFSRVTEAALLAYPLLLAGGLKMVVEDVRTGKPLSLVVSFALYGTALILVPRRLRAAGGD